MYDSSSFMLNFFPIQFLAPVAYALLRICIGIVFLYLARTHIRHRDEFKNIYTLPRLPYGTFFTWYVAIVEIVVGTLFIAGLFTQIAALISALYAIKSLILYHRFSHPLLPTRLSLTLILMVSLSLFITGAGIFAFDLPI